MNLENINMELLRDSIKNCAKQFTPEYLAQLSLNEYNNDREYPENFSNWYSHIKDFGYFKHSNIISNQIFTYEETEVMRETDIIDNVNWNKINEILKPTLDKMENYKLYSIKNGCFSNKFDFATCLATKQNLAEQLWKINYESAMFETGGYTELVVRELIPNSTSFENPTIYNGMPLREEIRVFYNLDTKQIEYIVDYWDYDYCRNNIASKTDQIIFDWFHNKMIGREINHNNKLNQIIETIKKNIYTLKFDTELEGIWSIDFLYEQYTDTIWLIDMARGYRSAYYDINKLKPETREMILNENR